jgi:hypothetical protein
LFVIININPACNGLAVCDLLAYLYEEIFMKKLAALMASCCVLTFVSHNAVAAPVAKIASKNAPHFEHLKSASAKSNWVPPLVQQIKFNKDSIVQWVPVNEANNPSFIYFHSATGWKKLQVPYIVKRNLLDAGHVSSGKSFLIRAFCAGCSVDLLRDEIEAAFNSLDIAGYHDSKFYASAK